MIRSLFFVARLALAWFGAFLLIAMVASVTPVIARMDTAPLAALATVCVTVVCIDAFSHLRRVRMIVDHVNSAALANRHRRRIDIPLEAGEAFDLVEAAIRELPRSEDVEGARDSLQVRAKIRRSGQYGFSLGGSDTRHWWGGSSRNQVQATVVPGGEDSCSVVLVCEPEAAAWTDWFCVDYATNLENAEALGRAIARRIAERRRNERSAAHRTSTEKELAVAKLSLLHAQVEPHFLYNTLASAQYLTRHDPAKADLMLGHLIEFLRRSLPRTEQERSTLGDELDRSRAYLEILKLRMGERLSLQIQVAEELRSLPVPPMILQTLVENAIKHGLEPKPAGGTVWIIARREGAQVAITVADDGRGFHPENTGTGIGLRNVRERLQLVYGAQAQLNIVANFPSGVAATLSLPAAPQAGPAAATESIAHV